MLSAGWHEGSLVIQCYGVGIYKSFGNDILVGGTASGEKITFEGVSYNLYKTSVDDVFYFGYLSGLPNDHWGPVEYPFNSSPYTIGSNSLGYNDLYRIFKVKIRFYSTSKSMAAGQRNVSGVDVIGGVFSSKGPVVSIPWSMSFLPFTFKAKGPTCKLIAPSEVKLKQVSVYKFSTLGSIVEAANFPLGVICSATIPNFEVSYAMQDVNNGLNASSNLTLTNGVGDASGLALQILDAGIPIKLSPSSSGVMGTLSGGAVSKSLSVQYIKTEPRITPGTVRGGVTVTLSYE
ncbi:fimbrial protein [Pseudomonas sp. AU8050]|uniref:fimbrial protein n=1 Tax=Pseudomonas sp. AU8050 TaxID=2681497 RepID=UPI00140C8530|nr:fimbrial protein [Pseudomonas sp. AU8050]NHC52160.1 hypothetical protein [Pseudomonas sp. AU8050]